MTKNEAIRLLAREALLMFEHDGSSTLDGDTTLHIINQIFDEHETAIEILMKANEEEISRHFNECEKQEAQLKAKDDEIELFKQLLEEAMKLKTCDGCKQSWEQNNQTFHKYFCEYLKIPVHGGFYCNRYEPKEIE